MNLIKNKDNPHLIWACETSAISAIDSLNLFDPIKNDTNSTIWKIHTSGLSFGIWVSSCDPEFITLDEVNEIIERFIKSSMN